MFMFNRIWGYKPHLLLQFQVIGLVLLPLAFKYGWKIMMLVRVVYHDAYVYVGGGGVILLKS